MKRHIQDFNRFSVNEEDSYQPMGRRGTGGIKTYEFVINMLGDDIDAGTNHDFIHALARNGVLLNVIEWSDMNGTTTIHLTGTYDAIKNVWMEMDPNDGMEFIEQMDEFGPIG